MINKKNKRVYILLIILLITGLIVFSQVRASSQLYCLLLLYLGQSIQSLPIECLAYVPVVGPPIVPFIDVYNDYLPSFPN